MLTIGRKRSVDGLKTEFDVVRPADRNLKVKLSMPGRHNVLNALAVIALSDHLDVIDELLVKALSEFKGVGRRFQLDRIYPKKRASKFLLLTTMATIRQRLK